MKEVWKAVVGFEGLYEVSSAGRVRSIARTVLTTNGQTRRYKGRTLRPGRSGMYVSVVLRKGNSCTVHSLVAATFLGPCPKRHEVRHLDGNGVNNRKTNLAYGTRSENNKDIVRHGRRKLSVASVKQIRRLVAAGGYGIKAALAREYGVWQSHIGNIVTRKYYKHV